MATLNVSVTAQQEAALAASVEGDGDKTATERAQEIVSAFAEKRITRRQYIRMVALVTAYSQASVATRNQVDALLGV